MTEEDRRAQQERWFARPMRESQFIAMANISHMVKGREHVPRLVMEAHRARMSEEKLRRLGMALLAALRSPIPVVDAQTLDAMDQALAHATPEPESEGYQRMIDGITELLSQPKTQPRTDPKTPPTKRRRRRKGTPE